MKEKLKNLLIPIIAISLVILIISLPSINIAWVKWNTKQTTSQLFCSRGLNIVEGEVESQIYRLKVENPLDFIYLVETLSEDKTTIRDQQTEIYATFWIFENKDGIIVGYYYYGIDWKYD